MAGGPIGGHGPNRVIEFAVDKRRFPADPASFDFAVLAAMQPSQRDTIITAPQVVASGMTPPDTLLP